MSIRGAIPRTVHPSRLAELHGKFCTLSNGRVSSSSGYNVYRGCARVRGRGSRTIKHNAGGCVGSDLILEMGGCGGRARGLETGSSISCAQLFRPRTPYTLPQEPAEHRHGSQYHYNMTNDATRQLYTYSHISYDKADDSSVPVIRTRYNSFAQREARRFNLAQLTEFVRET